MPYVISGNVDSDRMVWPEPLPDLARTFFRPIARGEPLTPELMALKPDPYYVRPAKRGGIPEIFAAGSNLWVVKENVKRLIDELEPGIHTFIPINVRVVGSDTDGDCCYYLLYPGQSIDAVVIEQTDFAEGRGREGFSISHTLSSFGSTVLDREKIRGKHLWRGGIEKLGGGGDPFGGYLFVSSELQDRLRAEKFEGWRFRECDISPAWVC